MKNLLSMMLLVLAQFVLANNPQYDLDEVTVEELSTTSYPLDPSANAIILFDIGSARFISEAGVGLRLEFSRKTKIKILTTDGTDAANRTLTLSVNGNRKEELRKLKAYSYNLLNGNIEKVKMAKDNVQKEHVHKFEDKIKFAVPNVRAGSIIEIEYVISTPFFGGLYPWFFQSEYPTVYSEYKIRTPEFLKYRPSIRGFINIESPPGEIVSEAIGGISSASTEVIMTTKDVPAFEPEPFISAKLNYISRINFELYDIAFIGQANMVPPLQNWADYDALILNSENLGGFLDDQKVMSKITENWNLNSSAPEEIMENCYYLLKDSLKWNGRHFFFNTNSAKQIWKERVGNSAELNLMLILLLREYNIKADPILISTRDNGYIFESYPSLDQYNHLICRATIDDKTIYLDLTGKGNAPGILPFQDLSLAGRDVLSHNWVSLEPAKSSQRKTFLQIQVDENMKLAGGGKINLTGYDALNYYERLFELNNELEQLATHYRQNFSSSEIKTVEFDNSKAIEGELGIKLNFSSSNHCQVLGNIISINPFVLENLDEPLFTSEERVFPIDFGYNTSESLTIQLTIPEGYSIKSLPEPSIISLPEKAGSIQYQCTDLGNSVLVNCKIARNKSVFTQDEYPLIKQFYELAIQKLSEPVLFEKI